MKFNNLLLLLKSFCIALIVLSLASGCKNKKPVKDPVEAISEDYVIPKPDSLFIQQVIKHNPAMGNLESDIFKFYSQRNYHCAWFNESGLTEQSGKILNLIGSYIHSGILDSSVLIPGATALLDSLSMEPFSPMENDSLLLRADVTMTAQFLKFSEKAWKGMSPKKVKELEWFLPVNKPSRVEYLHMILDRDNEQELSEPVSRPFIKLIEKVKQYSLIEKDGGWEQISPVRTGLHPGDTSEVIRAVRKRLAMTGELDVDIASPVFDEALVPVILTARSCYGLSRDTIIDKNLITELNVPVEERLKQMLINAERWKWIPVNPDSNFIVVNIPEFMMHVFENGYIVKNMKVIVGKEVNKTIIFSGDLQYIVFSPYWVIPKSIIAKETLPAVKKNPGYLSHHNMEIVTNSSPPKIVSPSKINFEKYSGYDFPYIIRQRPGPSNSLGHVKFLFPNSFSIYLHDTPSRDLFEEQNRTFSHGCIRLAEPAWLANYLLRYETEWDEQKIKDAMYSGKEKYVKLKKAVPVYLTYFTSWVDQAGQLNFRKDIYDHDEKLERELFN